jgi:alpha-L-arabinofuranosidase
VTPQYWAFWLYSNFAGDTPVSTRTAVGEYNVRDGVRRIPNIPEVPWLDVLATTDSHRRNLSLFVVNRNWQRGIQAGVNVQGFNPASKASVRTLTTDSILTRNDEVHPNWVRPLKSELSLTASTFQYEFPKHSLTVITLEPK